MTQWQRRTRHARPWLYENDRYVLISVVHGWRLVDKDTKMQHDVYATQWIGMREAEKMEAGWTTRNR